MRWRVVRTLLRKELLRCRYNWGLAALVAALLALVGLVSFGGRRSALPGQDSGSYVSQCCICFDGGVTEAVEWAEHLRNHPPSQRYTVRFHDLRNGDVLSQLREDPQAFVVELSTDPTARRPDKKPPLSRWQARFCYWQNPRRGMFPYRDWITIETHRFLNQPITLDASEVRFEFAGDFATPTAMLMTSLMLFALYWLSFNLYLATTGEERDKRILFALMLTPASPTEILAAKALFHGGASAVLLAAMATLFRPVLLLHPLLWVSAALGSLGYIAIGTVALILVRRATTLSTISLLYLVGTALVVFLSQYVPALDAVRAATMENYLHLQLLQLLADQPFMAAMPNVWRLAVIVTAWCAVAAWLFARRGTALALSR